MEIKRIVSGHDEVLTIRINSVVESTISFFFFLRNFAKIALLVISELMRRGALFIRSQRVYNKLNKSGHHWEASAYVQAGCWATAIKIISVEYTSVPHLGNRAVLFLQKDMRSRP